MIFLFLCCPGPEGNTAGNLSTYFLPMLFELQGHDLERVLSSLPCHYISFISKTEDLALLQNPAMVELLSTAGVPPSLTPPVIVALLSPSDGSTLRHIGQRTTLQQRILQGNRGEGRKP